MLKTCRDPLVYKLIKIQFIKEVWTKVYYMNRHEHISY